MGWRMLAIPAEHTYLHTMDPVTIMQPTSKFVMNKLTASIATTSNFQNVASDGVCVYLSYHVECQIQERDSLVYHDYGCHPYMLETSLRMLLHRWEENANKINTDRKIQATKDTTS